MTRKASDAAIERVAERWNLTSSATWRLGDYPYNSVFRAECDREQSLSDALRAHFGADVPASLAGYVLPVVVDPIVEAARRIVANHYRIFNYNADAEQIEAGNRDHWEATQTVIAELRAIAAQGGGA